MFVRGWPCLPMHGRPCSGPTQPNPAQAALAAALPPSVLHQQAPFERYEQGPAGVMLRFHGGQRLPVSARLLIGADGAQSGVREQLLGDGPPQYLGSAIWRGVAPLPPWWPGPGAYCLWLQQPRILRAFPLPGTGMVVWQVGVAAGVGIAWVMARLPCRLEC